jgi:hypothetical protein
MWQEGSLRTSQQSSEKENLELNTTKKPDHQGSDELQFG